MSRIKTFASVESFTGGAFAFKIVQIPGASEYFKGALVAYSNEVKAKLKIDTSNGVVNSATAKSMAQKGKEYFNVDYCFSFTGNAGPKPMENKENGLVFIGLNDQVYEKIFQGSRQEIIDQAVDFAYELFLEIKDKS